MDLGSINWVVVLGAAAMAFVLGGIWYGPLFGKSWQGFIGLTDEELANQGKPAVILGVAFLLTVVQAMVLAATMPDTAGITAGASHGLVIGLGFVATAFGINYLFSRHPRALFAIDGGYNVLQFALMGAVLGAFG